MWISWRPNRSRSKPKSRFVFIFTLLLPVFHVFQCRVDPSGSNWMISKASSLHGHRRVGSILGTTTSPAANASVRDRQCPPPSLVVVVVVVTLSLLSSSPFGITVATASEVQTKMIFMEHQISSCYVPVVRSFFIF
jgi:hypothetical protein